MIKDYVRSYFIFEYCQNSYAGAIVHPHTIDFGAPLQFNRGTPSDVSDDESNESHILPPAPDVLQERLQASCSNEHRNIRYCAHQTSKMWPLQAAYVTQQKDVHGTNCRHFYSEDGKLRFNTFTKPPYGSTIETISDHRTTMPTRSGSWYAVMTVIPFEVCPEFHVLRYRMHCSRCCCGLLGPAEVAMHKKLP